MSDLDVKELVRRARQGSCDAYDELVSRYAGRLFGYLSRSVGNRADAEELVQDVFVKMVQGLRTYHEREKFEVWLYRIAHNRIVDHWRKRRAGPMSEYVGRGEGSGRADNPADRVPSREKDPQASAASAEAYDQLQHALRQLSREQRETLLLRYFGGIGFSEIAEITHCPIGTALARAHRGLARLKTLLTE